jgi:hypothetical protein
MTLLNRNNGITAVFTTHRLTRSVDLPGSNEGWARYPKGFFGRWIPHSCKAKKSMFGPKIVRQVSGFGWKFSIEILAERHPGLVGKVFVDQTSAKLVDEIPATGTIGYLATTPNKRVRVIFQ